VMLVTDLSADNIFQAFTYSSAGHSCIELHPRILHCTIKPCSHMIPRNCTAGFSSSDAHAQHAL